MGKWGARARGGQQAQERTQGRSECVTIIAFEKAKIAPNEAKIAFAVATVALFGATDAVAKAMIAFELRRTG